MTQEDYFSYFGLKPAFAIDRDALDAAWRQAAARVHPDRFATAGPTEKRVAMQWASRINEAYRCLRSPLSRARYLCEQAGVDLQVETNTAMRPAFLMQQMEWREALDELREQPSIEAVAGLRQTLVQAGADIQADVARLLDEQQDYEAAAARVREWMFLERMEQAMADLEA
ncbi:MAG: Fe-S protein assembly co-chaperone HscB [Corticimicrobacter sp.]|uniref:Fe-S protein assembly co-chaperone HscB n=1 Tax=Corticimicrobacter sp. TaxID=2678536 RepID=UPI0032DBDC76